MMNVDGDFVPPGFSCYSWTQPGKSVVDQWKSSFEKAYSYYLVPNQRDICTEGCCY
jgi:hypothetical protein